MPTSKDTPIEEDVVKLAFQLGHKTILNKRLKTPN
jgi:hypothetical protein